MKSIKSDFDNLISDSFEIRSELPAVYQLRTKNEAFGTLTRVIYGQKDQKKPNRTILLVGETGTGKSTLINALVNSAMGVKFEDEVWFQIVEDEKRSQAESQTSDVMVYQIFEGQSLPFSLTIIDTPGFGDTRGLELDLVVSQRLFDLFRSEDGVQEIHAVGLVIKASNNRLSDRLLYIFDSVMALFGKGVEKKIIALVTYSNGTTPKNALEALEVAQIKCAKDGNNQPVHFLFDNQQKTERNTSEETAALKHSWDFTNKQIQKFTTYLDTSQPQKLTTTVEVLNERIRLTACIQNLKERIQLSEQRQKDIEKTQEYLKNINKQMKINMNISIEVDETYKDKEPISGGMWWTMPFYEGAVCCTRCKENCHYPGCTMAWYPYQCEVMKEGRCTVCTRKCPASAHVKENWKYVTKTRKVKKTLEELKKYGNEAECEEKTKKLSAEISTFLEEAYQHVIKLEQIALNVDSLSTFVHLDFLIEKLQEIGDAEKVEKLTKMKSAMEKKKRKSLLQWFFSFLDGKKR